MIIDCEVYADDPPETPEEGQPRNRVPVIKRCQRGGSWSLPAPRCRGSRRYGGDPDAHKLDCGFRCVAPVEEE